MLAEHIPDIFRIYSKLIMFFKMAAKVCIRFLRRLMKL